MLKPSYIIVHHSLTPDGSSKNWDAIKRYHIETNGWSDIGYHYGVERVGNNYAVFLGRSETAQGAHCKDGGMNTKSLGVCLVGNFDSAPPPREQWELALNLVKVLTEKHNIPRENVLGHREAQALAGVPPDGRKSCPGNAFDMDTFRNKL